MNKNEIREMLLTAGVRNLKEFGYSDVTTKNIVTVRILRTFFLSMLKDNLGQSAEVDIVIHELIAEIESAEANLVED